MANTKTTTYTVEGNKSVGVYFNVSYVDSQETGTIIYDSSVVAARLGLEDPLNCKIYSIKCSSNSAAAVASILWDATTDVTAFAFPKGTCYAKHCFKEVAGLPNTAGSGKTGDILFTCTGLAAGESITLVLDVRPS